MPPVVQTRLSENGLLPLGRERFPLAVVSQAWAPFAAIALQFGLIVLLTQQWDIKGLAVARVMQFAFLGFVVHHFLPLRFRLSFFAAWSLLATVVVLGDLGPQKLLLVLTGNMPLGEFAYRVLPGAAVIAIGLVLIGICHLPVKWNSRATLLVIAAIALGFVRANTDWIPDLPPAVWVVIGSMFVFRLMLYMYDLKHRSAPFSPARALSYFFMLPNVCFPLFPLVDYKTFCSTYFNEDWKRIYQTGLQWMLRGAFQLLLYQAVYQFAPLEVGKVSSTLGVAGFMLGTYLLYLHVSGQFHLIVGLLHMFGFNLPETHHLFLLASSFTDFWRRINIYWKDFIMKLFFYPSYFAMRKMGTLRAMTIATIFSFFLTWFLHSWQWFWIRGAFLFTWQDISFWTILAILVLVNARREATTGRQRKLTESRVTMPDRLVLGLKTIGTFCVICTLWTIWSSQSSEELRTLADAARRPSLWEIVVIVGVLSMLGLAGMIWGRSSRDTSEGKSRGSLDVPFHFWRSAAAVSMASAGLLLIPLFARSIPPAQLVVARLRHDVLNPRDMNQQRRGYYEELDAGRQDNRNLLKVAVPQGWNDGTKAMYRNRSDFLLSEIVPSSSGILSGVPASANRLGMRDREYSEQKTPDTFRIVLLGSSHEIGVGVENHETFENLVEDRLNSQPPDSRYSRWEILNMATAADSLLQKVLRLEQIGFQYQPDAVLFCVNPFDWYFVIDHLKKSLTQKIAPPPGYREIQEEVSRKAGIHGNMPALMIERRLRPHIIEIYEWVFTRLVQQSAQRGVRPILLYRPATIDMDGSEPAERAAMIRSAEKAGLEVIDLSPAYAAVQDRNTLILARWDDHTTVLGHRLLAETLFQKIVPLLATRRDPVKP